MKKILGLIILVGLLVAWQYPQENDQWKNKITPSLLSELEAGNTTDFIILMNDQADVSKSRHYHNKLKKGTFVYQKLKDHAKNSQRDVVKFLGDRNVPVKSFFIVNAIYTKGNLELVRTLAMRTDIGEIQANSKVYVEEVVPDHEVYNEREGIEWGIEKIGADQVWEMGYTGQDVIVAGADTGVEFEHSTIIEKYNGWSANGVDHNYSWHDAIHEISPLHNDSIISPDNNPCGLESIVPCDDHNHGTHTVGTMTGDDGEGNQIGVAPGSTWIACRNMERGWGSHATYIECYEWFLAPTDLEGLNADPARAPHVINNSWSCPPSEGCNASNWSAIETVITNLKSAGVVVVVSAGNSGSSCGSISTPSAIFEPSFTIGAHRPNDTIANFSSRGVVTIDSSFRMKPNVAAPGTSVRSCIRNEGFATWNGTSMAGPHVAGLVALMISANPALAGEVDLIEDIIEATAIPMVANQECEGIPGTAIPNAVYGYGRINALAAVEQALLFTAIEAPVSQNELLVYPNPFNNRIELSMETVFEPVVFNLFSAEGKLIHQQTFAQQSFLSETIFVESLSKGIYYYSLTGEHTNESGKLVKVD
jgi:subtilisin family serine protease